MRDHKQGEQWPISIITLCIAWSKGCGSCHSTYTLEATGKASAVEKVTGSDDGDGDELEIGGCWVQEAEGARVVKAKLGRGVCHSKEPGLWEMVDETR